MSLSKIPQIRWIGREDFEAPLPQHLLKTAVHFYKKCQFESLTLNIGDFILVANADLPNPGTPAGCDIAKILYLYELVDPLSNKDPYRAIVQWYSRPNTFRKYRISKCENLIDYNVEVLEDYRPFYNDISIETIFDKCKVIFAHADECPANLIKNEKNPDYVFVCRYKYLKSACNSWILKPILDTKKTQQNFDSTKISKKTSFEFVNVVDLTDDDKLKILCREYELVSPKKRLPDKVYDVIVTSPTKKYKQIDNNDEFNTPSKKISELPQSKRKSILKTSNIETPTKNRRVTINFESTPTSNRKSRKSLYYISENNLPESVQISQEQKLTNDTLKSTPKVPNLTIKLIRNGELTPSLGRATKRRDSYCHEKMNMKTIAKSLPCRENEFKNIYNFLRGKIESQTGGCMYISGVPGTGKTATVTAVINRLKIESEEDENLPEFQYIEINGMKLTEPRQAYVQIYKQITGKTITWNQAHSLLEKRFTTQSPRRTTMILLVDELDILCNRRQDVIYNLLDWPTNSSAKLVVIAIANTMDLPERLLMGKITSRMGLTRLTFSPYTHQQLQEIVSARLFGSNSYKNDAIQLIARKAAAVSGDARRALDICRRAIEISEKEESKNSQEIISPHINMNHVQQALSEMISSANVQALKRCSNLEKLFLQSVAAEVQRTGVEETIFSGVYSQMESIGSFMGISIPSIGHVLRICSKLGAQRLILCEHSRLDLYMKILLNVGTDDIHYALEVKLN